MSLCHVDHFPYSCDDDALHQVHHHHHHPHHTWCNAWFHSSCLTGQVSITKEDGFQLQIDVRHFKYDDLTVKTIGDWIIVEGKQSGNENDLPVCITKQFSRKYKLPRYYDSNLIKTNLSSDGILIVKVPSPDNEPNMEEKIIEIEKTGPFFQNDNNNKKTTTTASKNDNNKNGNSETTKDKINKSPSKNKTDEGHKSGKKDKKNNNKNLNNDGASTSAAAAAAAAAVAATIDIESGVKIEELNSTDDKMNIDNDKI